MATVVQLELFVNEQGAVSGVRKFDTAVKGSTGSVAQLDATLSKLNAHLDQLGQKAPQVKKIGDHALTSLDNVRLLRDDFGIHIPRAMEKAIASSKVLSGAIKGLGAGLIAFGAIEIGVHVFTALIEGAQKAWHEHLSLTAALKDYEAEVEKSRQQEFGNSHSIETTTLRINEATAAVKRYHDEALKTAHSAPPVTWRSAADVIPGVGTIWEAYHQREMAHDLQGKSVDAQKQVDQLTNKVLPEQQHKKVLDTIELEYTATGHLTAEQRVYNRLLKESAEHKENAAYAQNRDSLYFNPVAAAGATSQQKLEDAKSQREAEGELAEQRRADAQELTHLREQALEAGLRGIALYKAQEAAALEELKFKDMDSAAARNAVHLKFHNEAMKRLQDEGREIQKIRGEALAAGKTGVARVQQEGQNKTDEIYATAGTRSPGDTLALVKATQDLTAQQIGELNKSFKDRVDEIVGQSANRELQGFARIRAEATNQMRALDSEFAKNGGDPKDLARGKAAIGEGADRQQADLARKNAEETEQIEAEARSKFLSAEKQKTAAIDTEYAQRLQKLAEQLRQGEILEDDYNRRVAAAATERDAQMVEAATAAREKMAGEFDTLFKGLNHPVKMLQEMGDKVAGNAAAMLVQRMQGKNAGAESSSGSGLMDQVFGGFGGGFHIGKHGNPDKVAETGHGPAATGKTFAISTATIHIGSASFGGGGSTGLLASGSSGGGGGFGSGTYGSGDFAGGYSSGGNTLAFPGGGGASGGGAGASTPGGGGIGGNLSAGMSLFQQGKSIFGAKGTGQQVNQSLDTQTPQISGSFDKNGNFQSGGSTNGGMLGGGGFGANAAGAAGGALGMFSAVKGDGGLGGALGGAMSGMQLGMALGGPMGALIGAGAGAIVGAIGFGGREQARVYDLKTIRPKLTSDQDAYADGSMDYMSAYSDVQQMIGTSWAATKKMGPAAEKYWGDTIKPELLQAMGKFTAEQRAGRSMYTASKASYAVGSPYIPADMTAEVHKGESIFRADQNEVLTRSVGGLADLHSAYKQSMSTGRVQGWGGTRTVNMNVNAIDRAGVANFFDEHKHTMRSALNDSLAENSGGGL